MNLLADVPWWFRSLVRRLGQTSTIAVVIVLLCLLLLVGAGVVTVVETAAGSSGPTGYTDALWWFIVAITGVGLEAREPQTALGSATGASVLLLARVFFGMLTAAIASALINRLLLEGKGMGNVVLRNHTVICGWNSRGHEIINQLSRDERVQDIVILADLENTPVRQRGVHFVRGDPTNEKDLRRASVPSAETVIILADESVPGLADSTVDARSVLVALAVEAMNRSVYTCAEVRQPENRRHFEHASVDEIVVTNEIVSDLLARTSVHHGVSRVVSDLLTADTGSEVYVMKTPSSLVNRAFDDALVSLQSTKRAILLGVVRNGEIILNPQDPLVLAPTDSLVVIAHDKLDLP